ncbi:hypothetical protein WN51_01128 [Melipona quadrifasciata]|uniref:Uncharacterized protein n=1 Tax=Melipona quadrifasciata TaxID=166423 RepID=A0A0N0U4R7_9HYME|nr:hypothetical protein WN51_01128 [Melipona quadrifasciata]
MLSKMGQMDEDDGRILEEFILHRVGIFKDGTDVDDVGLLSFCGIVISYRRRVQKESDELLYTVWSLVMVRNQLPAQVLKVDG